MKMKNQKASYWDWQQRTNAWMLLRNKCKGETTRADGFVEMVEGNYIYTYIYIYKEGRGREREREGKNNNGGGFV